MAKGIAKAFKKSKKGGKKAFKNLLVSIAKKIIAALRNALKKKEIFKERKEI